MSATATVGRVDCADRSSYLIHGSRAQAKSASSPALPACITVQYFGPGALISLSLGIDEAIELRELLDAAIDHATNEPAVTP